MIAASQLFLQFFADHFDDILLIQEMYLGRKVQPGPKLQVRYPLHRDAHLGLGRADVDVNSAGMYLQAEIHERCTTFGQDVRVEALDVLLELGTVNQAVFEGRDQVVCSDDNQYGTDIACDPRLMKKMNVPRLAL